MSSKKGIYSLKIEKNCIHDVLTEKKSVLPQKKKKQRAKKSMLI
jgi:hypothetical protein